MEGPASLGEEGGAELKEFKTNNALRTRAGTCPLTYVQRDEGLDGAGGTAGSVGDAHEGHVRCLQLVVAVLQSAPAAGRQGRVRAPVTTEGGCRAERRRRPGGKERGNFVFLLP